MGWEDAEVRQLTIREVHCLKLHGRLTAHADRTVQSAITLLYRPICKGLKEQIWTNDKSSASSKQRMRAALCFLCRVLIFFECVAATGILSIQD